MESIIPVISKSVKVWRVANESLFPRAESYKQLKRMNSSFALSIGTEMGDKAVKQHLKHLKLTYGLNVSHRMKAVWQILFRLCRNILLEIKSDNTKPIFHGRVMRTGHPSRDFPRETSRSLQGWESRMVEEGNRAFPPRAGCSRLFPLLLSCVFPHPEMMLGLGSDCSFSVCFGEYLRRVRGLRAQPQPSRSPAGTRCPRASKGTCLQRTRSLARVMGHCGTEKSDSLKGNSSLTCNQDEILYFWAQ